MFPGRDESLENQNFEVLEHVAALTSHHLNELRRQLEGGTLEAEILRGVRQDEAVVDVYEVAAVVEQNVAVVTIFHLDKIGDDTVSGTASDEISLRL